MVTDSPVTKRKMPLKFDVLKSTPFLRYKGNCDTRKWPVKSRDFRETGPWSADSPVLLLKSANNVLASSRLSFYVKLLLFDSLPWKARRESDHLACMCVSLCYFFRMIQLTSHCFCHEQGFFFICQYNKKNAMEKGWKSEQSTWLTLNFVLTRELLDRHRPSDRGSTKERSPFLFGPWQFSKKQNVTRAQRRRRNTISHRCRPQSYSSNPHRTIILILQTFEENKQHDLGRKGVVLLKTGPLVAVMY